MCTMWLLRGRRLIIGKSKKGSSSFLKKRSKKLLLMGLMVPIAGCADRTSFCYPSDIFTALPESEFETLTRVCGQPPHPARQIATEPGNVWPQAPNHVPTMLELQKQAGPAVATNVPDRSAPRRPRDNGLCRPASHAPGVPGRAPPGVALGLCYVPLAHGISN
jgi:hypothetical protein